MTDATHDPRCSRIDTPFAATVALVGFVVAASACQVLAGFEETAATACEPGERQCLDDTTPQVCEAGRWVDELSCAAPFPACSGGSCVATSCADDDSTCGLEGQLSCCESFSVPGFRFPMGRSETAEDAFPAGLASEQPEHEVTVDGFFLDAFEITVGRFRKFVDQYDGTPPPDGAGEHPLIPGTGWSSAFDAELPATRAELVAQLNCSPNSTYSDEPGVNDDLPLNCATWFELLAFCIWDGGRLPTEAEWEYAAAGGLANRLRPWGSEAPTLVHASFDCAYGETPGTCTLADIPPVGSMPSGAAMSGQRDMAGGMWEWTVDRFSDVWYAEGGNTCDNCANLDQPTTMGRTIRGGGFDSVPDELRAVRRDSVVPDFRADNISLRCAR